jgi:hypothetical protein
MPEFDVYANIILRVLLSGLLLWLIWEGASWRGWPLMLFPFFSPEVQTLTLACIMLWAGRADRIERQRKSAEIKSTASLFAVKRNK